MALRGPQQDGRAQPQTQSQESRPQLENYTSARKGESSHGVNFEADSGQRHKCDTNSDSQGDSTTAEESTSKSNAGVNIFECIRYFKYPKYKVGHSQSFEKGIFEAYNLFVIFSFS